MPASAPPPKLKHAHRGDPLEAHEYRDAQQRLLGVSCWWRDSAGAWVSQVRTWCRNAAGEHAWRWCQFERLRPLYGLDRLATADEIEQPYSTQSDVLIVFDELQAEAARRLLVHWVPLSWPGGVKRIDEVDWSPLRGRLVVILPPHGAARSGAPGAEGKLIERVRQPTVRAAQRIAGHLAGYQAKVLAIVDTGPLEALADGWTLLEAEAEGWSSERAIDWLHARLPESWPVKKDAAAVAPGAPPVEPVPEQTGTTGTEPIVVWREGELPRVVNEAEAALLASQVRLFQRAGAGMIVRVVRRDAPTIRNYQRPPHALAIVMVEMAYLVETFTRVARWERWDSKQEAMRRINAPDRVASTYLGRVGEWRLPILRGTISSPTLRPDGSVLQVPGYDRATQLWYDPCGVSFPKIPERPTREHAEAALALLKGAFASMPFKTEVDRSVALALVLTGLVRRNLPTAPLGAISSPVPRTGKTLLADCIATLVMGTTAPAMTLPSKDEEAEKTALSVLMLGDPVVLIDNVERPLTGEWLCAMLTSERKSARILGKSEMVSAPTNVLFLATGNHLVIAGDMRSRALICWLDAEMEHPERRQFGVEIRESLMAARAQLVVAGLTIMRAFCATGQSPAEFIPQWGGFEQWSAMVRAPLVWLGCADPCDSFRDIEENDPDRIQHLQMIEAWVANFEHAPATARQAVERAGLAISGGATDAVRQIDSALRDVAIGRKTGEIDAKVLGNWLRKHADRPVSGRQFVKAGDRDHSLLWKVPKVT